MIALLLLAASFLQSAPTYSVGGVTVDAVTGRPLPKTRLFLAPSGRDTERIRTVSDNEGRFRFDGVPAGKYSLSAERLGYTLQAYNQRYLGQGYASAIVAGDGEVADSLVFRMLPGAVITGTIVDSNGDPVPRLTVQAVRALGCGERRRPQRHFFGFTDDRGMYRIHSLPAGTYAVAVASGSERVTPSYQRWNEPMVYPVTYFPGSTNAAAATAFELFAGQEYRADLVVRAAPAARIRGTVVDAKSLKASVVTLTVPGLFGGEIAPIRRASVYSESFSMQDVPAGRCTLYLWNSEGRPIGRRAIDVVAPETTVSLGEPLLPELSAAVSFREEQPTTGIPVVLRLTHQSRNAYTTGMVIRDDKPSVIPVFPGRYDIQVQGRRQYAVVSFEATGATRAADGTLEIPETGKVELRVVASAAATQIDGRLCRDGKPQAGVTALLVPRENWRNTGQYRLDQSDSDGSFSWYGVLPGKYLMFAFDEGEPYDYLDPALIQPLMADAQPLTVTAEPKQKARLEMKSKKDN